MAKTNKEETKTVAPVDYTKLSQAELIEELKKKDQDVAVIEGVNKELMDRNTELERETKVPGNRPTVKVDGKTYFIRCAHTNYKGVLVSAEQIQNDAVMAKEMVDMGSKLLILKK